jgi:hypothetical protein
MGWANWFSALGNIVEIGGFIVLAKELMGTNTAAIMENSALRAKMPVADRIIVCDGDGEEESGIYVEGGLFEKLIENINRRQAELTVSKRLIFHGLALTGVGVVIQTAGSIGQALGE